MQVHSVPAHVDQLPGHRVGPRIDRLAHRLIAAAYRGHHQHSQDWVQQPPCASAAYLSSGPKEHPHDEPEQYWRPHPAEHILNNGARRKE